jgi:hypothetical protein
VHEGLLRNDRVLLLPHMGMLRFDS